MLSRAELQPTSLVPALPPALSLVIAGWWGQEKLEQGAGGSEGRRRAKDTLSPLPVAQSRFQDKESYRGSEVGNLMENKGFSWILSLAGFHFLPLARTDSGPPIHFLLAWLTVPRGSWEP